jgi:transposase
MATTTRTFSQWLTQAQLRDPALTVDQRAVLQAAFRFRQNQGADYYANRLLSHFLLHCGAGLKVAQVARLVGVSRPTASRQQGLSAKEAIQQAHHRMDGRPYGKLLPRYAGPIAQFLCTHPQATRYDVLDFIDQTFGVRASRIALYHFLKKYGLDRVPQPRPADACPVPVPPADAPPADAPPAPARAGALALLAPVPVPAPPFCLGARTMPAPSC